MKRGEGRWCKLPAESVAMANMAAPVKVVARITTLLRLPADLAGRLLSLSSSILRSPKLSVDLSPRLDPATWYSVIVSWFLEFDLEMVNLRVSVLVAPNVVLLSVSCLRFIQIEIRESRIRIEEQWKS